MKLTDDMLRQSAAVARDAMLASLPEPEDCPADCSPRLLRRLDRLLRRQRHPVFYGAVRQIAACFLAVLVLGGGWLAVDSEARAGFFQWARQVYETQIVYRFAGEPAAGGVYRLGWVPEGYTEMVVHDDPILSSIIYVNADEKLLGFDYGPMQEGSTLYVVNTDQATMYPVEINGIPGEFYVYDNDTSNALVWLDETSGMCFSISGFLDESDMLHMAESIYLKEFTK
ncbi:MAG: DUF4367 domain-containing protein [Oscillospiraceae bacterium]|nr:DUF4367 domain-containing protein [Oscillospiraceae bacterium]